MWVRCPRHVFTQQIFTCQALALPIKGMSESLETLSGKNAISVLSQVVGKQQRWTQLSSLSTVTEMLSAIECFTSCLWEGMVETPI